MHRKITKFIIRNLQKESLSTDFGVNILCFVFRKIMRHMLTIVDKKE
jgi:hypothetical protein